MRSSIKKLVERYCKAFGVVGASIQSHGLHFRRGPNPLAALLEIYQINLVLDVGANVGQYARDLRLLGYKERIVSFEPAISPFQLLERASIYDDKRTAIKMALGSSRGSATLNLYGKSTLNSLLPLLDMNRWSENEPSHETVDVERLDNIFKDLAGEDDRVFLKLDTQGTEKTILDGASGVLDRIISLQLEVSFHTTV